ncbi:ABC transporter ATP-binding protein [Candidatus Saccharibacteria bacterium]|nr:ABC transporter ATP-binding protein [Candidatus Saccharibacteria bacterium]
MRYYVKLIKKYLSLKAWDKKLLTELFITAILRTGTKLLIPIPVAVITDSATKGDYQYALIFTAVFFVVTMLYTTLHHLNYVAYAKNSTYIHDFLQRKILDKVISLDQDYTKKLSHEAIVNTGFEDVVMCQRIPDYFIDLIFMIVSIFADAIILVFVDPLIGGITFVLTMLSFRVFIFHMKKRDYYAGLRRTHQDEIASLYNQIIEGHKEVHAFNLEENLRSVINEEKQNWKKQYFKQRIHSDLGGSLTPFIQGAGRIIAYGIAAYLILRGEYSVATLVLVMGYYENMQASFDEATDIIYEITRSNVAINRVYRLLNYKPPRRIDFGKNNNDDINGEIVFEDVSFTYGRKPLMRNVSFEIEPHSLVGIVGKSGSGKSTIFRLLLRLYKPTRGKILIDGKDIFKYDEKVHATNVSIVTQKPFVFDMTIRENLSLVNPDFEQQVAACKKVGIHDDIMRLEKGYNTRLVSDGENLSAGQKQLLSLARTLLSKSEILLFDEVTSALDADTTEEIIKVLKKLKTDHTVLVITHKPEVMQKMDELIVIEKGALVGRGTHRDLLRNNYYKLLQK